MYLNLNPLRERLFSLSRRRGNSASATARRKRAALEPLEGRNLLAAMPVCGDAPSETKSSTAIVAKPQANTNPLSTGDLADWQSNYGAVSGQCLGGGGDDILIGGDTVHRSIGGGVDVLIANTGGDRAVDEAFKTIGTLPQRGVGESVDIGGWGNDWISGGTGQDAPLAPKLATNVGLEATLGNQGRDLLLGGAGADATAGPVGTASDDVIVDGRIITAENYQPASATPVEADSISPSGQTVRLRIATVNNVGK